MDGWVAFLFNWFDDWWLAGWFIDYLFDWLTKPIRFLDLPWRNVRFCEPVGNQFTLYEQYFFIFTERAINPKTRKHLQVRLVRNFKEKIHSSRFYVNSFKNCKKRNTEVLRYNEPLDKEGLDVMNDSFRASNSKIYGKQPRYNDRPRYSE